MLKCEVLPLIFCVIRIVTNMEVFLERAKVTYYDTSYIEYATANVRRYSRGSPYCFNAHAITKHTWDNNITINYVFYEYLHNEYRRSFVQTQFKYCDLLTRSLFLGSVLRNVPGVNCPLPPGNHSITNLTYNSAVAKFPNVFPIEQTRVQIEICLTETKRNILKGYVDAMIRNKIPKADTYSNPKKTPHST